MRTTQEIQVAQFVPEGGGEPGAGGGGLNFVLLMVALFLLMYALIIRPQQRQRKEQQAMVASIKKGDHVVTNGGIHGRVTGVADDVLTVEIAERVRIKLERGSVSKRTLAADKSEKDDRKAEKKEARS